MNEYRIERQPTRKGGPALKVMATGIKAKNGKLALRQGFKANAQSSVLVTERARKRGYRYKAVKVTS